LIQYSILVNQYSISKREYEFWNNLKQINETGNDIFSSQPYSVINNLHCISNPQERVLGYFQVSAVSQQRKNILHRDVALMGLPFYSDPCKTLVLDLSYLPGGCKNCPPPSWDDLYWRLCIGSDYIFTEPIYNKVSDVLLDLVFTRPECADCELTGSSKKPDFWIDLNWIFYPIAPLLLPELRYKSLARLQSLFYQLILIIAMYFDCKNIVMMVFVRSDFPDCEFTWQLFCHFQRGFYLTLFVSLRGNVFQYLTKIKTYIVSIG